MQRMRRGTLVLGLMLAGAASAQTPPDSDPIGAVLDQAAAAPTEPSPPVAGPVAPALIPTPPPLAPPPVSLTPPSAAPAADLPPPAEPDPETEEEPEPAPPPTATARPPSMDVWLATPSAPAAVTPSAPPPPPAYIPRGTPPAPFSYAPPPQAPLPRLTAPVHIEETGKTPDRPLNTNDLNYEMRLRSSSAAAQGMQGPLDGLWLLMSDDGGGTLYSFQLVDSAANGLEGAWRDPRRPGAADSSGFLDLISRGGSELSLRFRPRSDGATATVTLSPAANGTWRGELTERGDRRAVTFRRR